MKNMMRTLGRRNELICNKDSFLLYKYVTCITIEKGVKNLLMEVLKWQKQQLTS